MEEPLFYVLIVIIIVNLSTRIISAYLKLKRAYYYVSNP